MTVAETVTETDQLVDELRTWLWEQWDPELTVGQWWERLGLAGWAAPGLPPTAYGRGLGRGDVVRVQTEIAHFGALGAPAGLGLLLAAPTIAAHGTPEQIDRFVRPIVTGTAGWCQLFSEPGAGSDLAGLTTRAVRDGDEWIVNGQKVWTSFGHMADVGMLLARTDPEVPKHQGITWFAIDMHQPGIEVRPLREMSGRAMFNEVFLTDARVADDAVIGGQGHGWAVANTTLAHERSGLGAGGGGGGGGGAMPGTVARHLDRRAGDFAPRPSPRSAGTRTPPAGSPPARGGARGLAGNVKLYADLARQRGVADDPGIRQDLVRLHVLGELGRFNNLRLKAAREAGQDIPGMANLAKLAMSDMVRLSRDVGLRILGPYGTLHGYGDEERAELARITGNPFHAMVTETALMAQAPPIYGGTDQIQRNIVAERVLGLPRDGGEDRTVPFSQLPRTA